MENNIKKAKDQKMYSEQLDKRREKNTQNSLMNKHHFFIESTNSFPTASGMASSASGLACLASALNALFGNIFT